MLRPGGATSTLDLLCSSAIAGYMPDTPRPVRPRVIVTRTLLPQTEARMAELFDTVLNADDRPMDRAALAAAMADCDVLVPTVTDAIDAELINAAPDRLRLIASFGTGYDHIDLKAARARGILVTNTPGVLSEDTADMTMTLILSVTRRFSEGVRLLRAGQWKGWGPSVLLGHRVSGKTLGIVGFGRTGMAVAARARAFGLNVLYNKRKRLPPSVEEAMGVTFEGDLDRLLQRSDIVSLHCPLTAETENLIDARRIALMKSDAYFINTSRGEIVDETALIDALERGHLGGAGLDVYAHEPAVNPRLFALPNVATLPHMGSATFEAREASGDKVIANIRIWADGHRPPDQVLEGF